MAAARFALLPRGWRHWRWIILGVAAFLFWLALCYRLYLWDEPPPRDADFAVTVARIPARQNGLDQIGRLPVPPLDFSAFMRAHGVLDEIQITRREFAAARDDALVNAFLAQARPVLSELDAILALPHFETSGPITYQSAVPNLGVILNAAKTLDLAARHDLQVGDFPDTVRSIERLRLLAFRLTENHALLINYVLAYTIYHFSASDTLAVLNDPALPPRQLVTLANASYASPATTEPLQHSLAAEYRFLASAFAAEKDGSLTFALYHTEDLAQLDLLEFWRRFSLKPNTTLHLAADLFRTWSIALTLPYASANFSALAAAVPTGFPAQPNPIVHFVYRFAPNYGGRYALHTLAPTLLDVTRDAYTEVAVDRLLRIGFALRHYFDDHGSLPSTLVDLVPDYLPAVPTDPFNGARMNFLPSRGLVYSVGTDLNDHTANRPVDKPLPDLSPTPAPPLESQNSKFDPAPPPAIAHSARDQLTDSAQPTLALTFQNVPPAPARNSAAPAFIPGHS
jgi:hypothetical protein